MEDTLGDHLQCEEQLKNALYNNDKEKLRQKLNLLQKEYLRTVQRLKRAERVETVRRHVRSRITQHNHHGQTEADAKPPGPCAAEQEGTKDPGPSVGQEETESPGPSVGQEETESPGPSVGQERTKDPGPSVGQEGTVSPGPSVGQEGTEDPGSGVGQEGNEDPGSGVGQAQLPLCTGLATAVPTSPEKHPQTVRFSLASDPAFAPTPELSKSSPSFRLRSRRSRLRWAEKSAESDHSQEVPKSNQNVAEEQENYTRRFNQSCALNESQELMSPSANKSPSLLLQHWNLQGHVKGEETANQTLTLEKGKEGSNQHQTPNTNSSFKDINSHIYSCSPKNLQVLNHHSKDSNEEKEEMANQQIRLEREVTNDDDNSSNSLLIQNRISPYAYNNSKLENVPENGNQQQASAEVKADKTKPKDGGHRLLDSCTLVDGLLFPAEYYIRTTRRMSVLQSWPDMNAVILSHLHKGRQGRGRGRGLRRSVSEDCSVLEAPKDASDSPRSFRIFNRLSASLDGSSVSAIPSSTGRKRGRGGRGRRRGQARRSGDMKENTTDLRTNGVLVASSPSKCRVPSVAPESVEVQPTDADHEASALKAKEAAQTLDIQEEGHVILQSNKGQTNGEQEKTAPEAWADLLLPSSSQSDGPALSPPPPHIPLIRNLLSPDIQDFHLPDDQFGFLKLLKLRQIINGVEQFKSSPNNCAAMDLCPRLIPFSPYFSTPQTGSEDVPVSPVQVSVENRDASNREKQGGCSSPKRLKLMSSSERKNWYKDQILCLNVKNFEGTTLEGLERMVEVVSLRKTQEQNENNSAIVPKWSDDSDSECLNTESNFSEKDSQAHSIQIQPQNMSVFEKSPTKCMENMENNQTNTKSNELQCEEDNSPNNKKAPSQIVLSPQLPSTPSPCTPRPVVPSGGVVSSLPLAVLAHSPDSVALTLHVLTPPMHLNQDQCEAPATQEPSLTGQAQSQQRRGEEVRDGTCTLKGERGRGQGSLVDVCCVSTSSGALSVAAAGQWAVSLWSQGQPCEWSLTHTWTFEEPVLHVFPLLDTPDWFCVTLGQLEIRQVRVLSCSSLAQIVLCSRPAHLAIAAPRSRVVCCFHTPASSTIQVFTVSQSSPPKVRALACPGALLSSLAPVDGLPDALIGMDRSGCLFIWNMVSGHLLKRLTLGEAFSHSACLRGYSSHGALFVLMQHHLQGHQEEPGGGQKAGQDEPLFSLVATNPRNGKSVLARVLCAPDQWCGSVSAAAVDVPGSRLLALSHRGSVCVWDLERPRDPRPVSVPSGSQGWRLARWGAPGILLTALQTGDVTLHRCTHGSPSIVIQTLRYPAPGGRILEMCC